VAVEAIILLSKGSSHRIVYAMLQNYRRKRKQEKMYLWEEHLPKDEDQAKTPLF
jgi:hypothetical protein